MPTEQPALFDAPEDIEDGKSPGAYRTIGEVSIVLDIQQHVLRFWETQFPEIAPAKLKGRRYYTPETVALITQIRDLLYTHGYTIKGAQQWLRGGTEATHNNAVDAAQREGLLMLREKLNVLYCKLTA